MAGSRAVPSPLLFILFPPPTDNEEKPDWRSVPVALLEGRHRFHPLLDTCSSGRQHGAAEGALIPSRSNPLPVWVLRESSCLWTFLWAEKDSGKKRSVCRVQT